MTELAWVDTGGEHRILEPLWDDGERIYCRTWRNNAQGVPHAVMAVLPAAEHPAPNTISQLAHEFALKDYLDDAWAARPLQLVHSRGRTLLLLESCGTGTLDSLLGKPLELGRFLRLAAAITHAIGRLHERGLVHKDLKPENVLIDILRPCLADRLWHPSRLPGSARPRSRLKSLRARLPTCRLNRPDASIVRRMHAAILFLGGHVLRNPYRRLPFSAVDPLEWVHAISPGSPVPPVNGAADSRAAIRHHHEAARQNVPRSVTRPLPASKPIFGVACRNGSRMVASIHFLWARDDSRTDCLIPEKLYGREDEVSASARRMRPGRGAGGAELVLVSGYSGVGKSSVVNELHKVLVPPRGLFAAGKFDQYKRDVPYATLAQAFQMLVRQILVKSEAEMDHWRRSPSEALGLNGQLMVDLIPEIEFVIRQTAARGGTAAARSARPFPVGVSAFSRRLRPPGASACVVPRRSAMAGYGHPRTAGAPDYRSGRSARACWIGAWRDNESFVLIRS